MGPLESENRTLNAISGRNKHFPRHFPAFVIASDGHSTVTVGCTIAYMRLI